MDQLLLSVNEFIPLNVTACSSFDWNGINYVTSGVYTFSTMNAANCDSTATLNLTINQPTTSSTSITSCVSYLWNGTTYTTSGTYTSISQNTVGCDSIETLLLNIASNPATVNVINPLTLEAVSAGSNLTYRWINCDLAAYIQGATGSTFTASSNGNYAVEISNGTYKSTSPCILVNQVGVNENEEINFGIQVYPNPTNANVTILMFGLNQADVRIHDASGKLIRTISNLNSGDTISFEEYAYGVYTLQIQTQYGVKIERIIKN